MLAAIVGSGIMAERLAGGNEALALLCNSLATGAILVVLIAVFGPVSGAHLNPAVTVALTNTFAGIGPRGVPPFIIAQLVGAIAAASLSGWLLPERAIPQTK